VRLREIEVEVKLVRFGETVVDVDINFDGRLDGLHVGASEGEGEKPICESAQ